MRLIYEQTGEPVNVGDVVRTASQDSPLIVRHIQEPRKPSSTGRVYVEPKGGEGWREYFPSVIGAKWIERTDGGA